MSKLIKWGLVVLVAWWVITAPAAAGHEVHRLMSFAGQAAHSLTVLVSSI